MKILSIILSTTVLLYSSFSFGSGTRYQIRVDGLACPFCAYGIEKKFVKTEGVERVDIDMIKGLVIVTTSDGKTFTAEKLKEIIDDTGFTMKSMTQNPL